MRYLFTLFIYFWDAEKKKKILFPSQVHCVCIKILQLPGECTLFLNAANLLGFTL